MSLIASLVEWAGVAGIGAVSIGLIVAVLHGRHLLAAGQRIGIWVRMVIAAAGIMAVLLILDLATLDVAGIRSLIEMALEVVG